MSPDDHGDRTATCQGSLVVTVDVVTILSPRRYNGCCFDFSASEPASPDFASSNFRRRYLPSAFLWLSEMVLRHGVAGVEEIAFRLCAAAAEKNQVREVRKNLSIACENTASKSGVLLRGATTDSKMHCSRRLSEAAVPFIQLDQRPRHCLRLRRETSSPDAVSDDEAHAEYAQDHEQYIRHEQATAVFVPCKITAPLLAWFQSQKARPKIWVLTFARLARPFNQP